MKKVYVKMICTIVVVTLLAGLGCAGSIGVTADVIEERNGEIILENNYVSVHLDTTTGYLKTITNVVTGVSHKDKTSGSWPFRLTFSNGSEAAITYNTTNRLSNKRIYREGSQQVLECIYDNLLTTNGTASGVSAVVRYRMGTEDSYFSFDVEFSNGGSWEIKKIDLAYGGQLYGGAGAELVIPTWGEMAKWTSPQTQWTYTINNPKDMGYPGTGWGDLEMGFMDYSNQTGGIGIAYINKSETVMDFYVGTDGRGMLMSPVLLQPKAIAHANAPVRVGPGETFSTDSVVVAAHCNDWHTMADIYRTEYQKAFTINGQPDYLTWETISDDLKSRDVMLRFHQVPFDKVVTAVQSNLANWGSVISADRLAIWYSGQNEHGYGHDTPTMVPTNPNLGGDAGFLKMHQALHAMGASVFIYQHPSAYAEDSSDLPSVSGANPNQNSGMWDGVNHYYLCIDNDAVMNLWKNKLLPEMMTVSPDGLQFDQGSLQFTVCNLPGHNHDLTAQGRLSSHIKAMVQLTQYTRNNLKAGKTSYIVSEGFNDLTCRYIDMSQTRWDKEQKPVCGGELIYGGRQYVFPQYINQYSCASPRDDGVWVNMRQFVAVAGGIACMNEGEASSDTAVREYLWLKAEMRRIDAPGYPNNYRDTVGLLVNNDRLWARCFTEGDKITITFWAQKKVDAATITVNPAALGLPGNARSFDIELASGKTGYIVLNAKSGEVLHTSVKLNNEESRPTDPTTEPTVEPTVEATVVPTQPTAPTESAPANVEQPTEGSNSGNQQEGVNTALVVAAVILAVVVLLVASVIFVLITEMPRGAYELLSGIFGSKKK